MQRLGKENKNRVMIQVLGLLAVTGGGSITKGGKSTQNPSPMLFCSHSVEMNLSLGSGEGPAMQPLHQSMTLF